MKKLLAIFLALALVLSLAACGGGKTETTKGGSDDSLAGTYDIKVWVAEAAVDLTKKQIDDFNASNSDGIKINATIQPVGESDIATQIMGITGRESSEVIWL